MIKDIAEGAHPISLIVPDIFAQFPEIVAAQSTRSGGVSKGRFGMNLSSHVGDESLAVEENRRRFLKATGVSVDARVVYQNQIHSANISYADGSRRITLKSDALWTDKANLFLAITIADCTPILLYDPVRKLIAAVHAGWRGTEQHILHSTVRVLIEQGSSPKDIYAFVGASASCERYEVGGEVATLFEKKHYKESSNGKFLLDVKAANVEQLVRSEVPLSQIEVSPYCTITEDWLHSYRRDGAESGRMLALIGMQN